MREAHTQPVGNHPSAPKTLARLRWHFYWPQMATDCHKYCASCIICAGRKGQGRQKKAPLRNITPPDYPLDLVTIDILNLGGTPSGNCKALVAVDYLSKFVFMEPMPNEKADTLARTYQKMFKYFGYPYRLLSDRGSNFRSAQFQDLCLRMNTKRSFTTIYHPQSDGETERANRSVMNCISCGITETGLPWDEVCDTTVMAYNSTVHSAHGKMPAEVLFGRTPNLPSESPLSYMVSLYSDDLTNDQTDRLKKGWEAINKTLVQDQKKRKEYYDKTAKPCEFTVGDFVLWRDKGSAHSKLGKLAKKFAGPFEIINMREPNAVLLTRTGEEFVVHVNMLSPVTKELKESGQVIESTRKKPVSSKVHEKVTVPERSKAKTKYPLRSREESTVVEADFEKKSEDESAVDELKQVASEQRDGLLISGRTRSKTVSAKSVQTEPATVSVGTNTYSVSFDEDAPTVKEFLPYRTAGDTDLTWSQAHDQKNIRLDYYARLLGTNWWNNSHAKNAKKRAKKWAKKLHVQNETVISPVVYARRATVMHDCQNITKHALFQFGGFQTDFDRASEAKRPSNINRGRGTRHTSPQKNGSSAPSCLGCKDRLCSQFAASSGLNVDSGACLESRPFDGGHGTEADGSLPDQSKLGAHLSRDAETAVKRDHSFSVAALRMLRAEAMSLTTLHGNAGRHDQGIGSCKLLSLLVDYFWTFGEDHSILSGTYKEAMSRQDHFQAVAFSRLMQKESADSNLPSILDVLIQD